MYSIGQVSEMSELPVSTLRYYDKEGLLLDIQCVSGIREFSENELEALRVVDCLKKSGLEIKDIKQFMGWNKEGSRTFEVRKELFEKQREVIEEETAKLERVLAMLNYRSWYYEEAIKAGNEEAVLTMIPDDLPQHVKEAYVHSHRTNG